MKDQMTAVINQEDYINNSDPLNSNQLKILFFAPILSYPPKGGPELSVINAIKVLNKVCELHIVTTVSKESLESSGALTFLKGHSFNLAFAPKSISVGHASLKIRATRFIKREIFPSLYLSLEAQFIKNYALKERINIFWIDRVLEHSFVIYKKVRRAFPSAIIIGDTEAVYSRFILRELPLVNNPIRWLKILYRGKVKEFEERELVKTADIVTAVSNVDIMYFRTITGEKSKIMSFSNTIDLSDFKNITVSTTNLKQPCVLLLGTFGHLNSPMDRAARWLTNTIMPLVWKRVPNLHLYIIGLNAHLTQSSLNSENVTVVGSPPSVLPFLKKAIATLVPLKFESGTRFKIVESGAASVACISTSLGAEGLNVTDKEDILIADNELDFSEAIIKVVTTPLLAKTLGKKLHDLVRDSYSLDTQLNEAKLIIKYIKGLASE
jgi:glycosyltransferase involved in cell wall biosynthesis